MKKTLLFAASILAFFSLSAQTEEDALRFSQYGLNGTSNYISKAGAIGALGGDMTSASYNPAGLGLYTSSEFTMSLGYYGGFTQANSNGLLYNDYRSNMNLGNLGALFNFKTPNNNFKNTQIAFGLNRLKAYGNRSIYQRDKVNKSYISHIIAEGSSDAFMNDFYESYVVDFDTTINDYTSVFQSGEFSQIRSIEESGSLNEMTFSLSSNYQDLLYFGATVGIPYGNYHREMSFSETRYNVNSDVATDRYIYNEKVDLYASGINFKAGVIAKPISFLRIGAAIHTPTYYNIEDRFYSEVSFEKTVGGDWEPIFYDLQTPFKFLGSLALVLGDKESKVKGTLSADYEYSDYSLMKFRTENILDETTVNNDINRFFRATNTLKFGGELKLGSLALRCGYAMMENPYKSDRNDASMQYITGGFGIKSKHYFMDFAYAYSFGNSVSREYDYKEIDLKNTQHIAQVTLGVKF
ncbi:MAG: hypothetical protein H6Q15_798 [Bacteroidetes bacterium]|nr:hypothetical protein [Bacteroidota bacterium]